jgi:putative PIN family toxin of toxin-antitoxin system
VDLPQIVIDSSVIIAGLRSKRGYAFQLLSLVGKGRFDIHLSVPLVLEYEEVLLRELSNLYITRSDVNDFLNYHCSVARLHEIFFLWRPHLRDPSDDMLLELALKAGCDSIVTYNKRDFRGAEQFGIEVIDPGTLLNRIGGMP